MAVFRPPPKPFVCGSKLFIDLASESVQEFDGITFLESNNLPLTTDLCIFGTVGDDLIVGGYGDDIIYGFGGDDIIYGLNGNDILFGSSGSVRQIFRLRTTKHTKTLSSAFYIAGLSCRWRWRG